MKTKFYGAVIALFSLYSCGDSTSKNATGETDSTAVKSSTVTRQLEMPKEEWRDPYFPRFSISEEDFNKMTESYRAGCNLEADQCEMQSAEYEFDQLAAIEFVHGNSLEEFKGRYGDDGNDENRYRALRGLGDSDDSKVSGYATLLYSIQSKNPLTEGKIFYYDLASICPPPYGTCVRGQGPNDSLRL